MSDLISRADAIEAVAKLCVDGYKAKVDGYFIPLTDALINTLSALPSADAVSREDYHNLLTATEDIDRALREYQAKDEKPSADAKHNHGDGQWYDLTDALTVERNEWIPVSERLPEENETVLISAKYIEHLCKNDPYVEEGFLTHDGWYSAYGDNYSELAAEVVAWMPLPKPYREDGEV